MNRSKCKTMPNSMLSKIAPNAETNCNKIAFSNICSTGNKTLNLELFCKTNSYNVMGLSEHWRVDDGIDYCKFNNYVLANKYCRTSKTCRGVALYAQTCLNFRPLDLSFLCEESNFEATAITLSDEKRLIVSFYGAPSGDPLIFINKLEELFKYFSNLKWKNFKIVIRGDLNSELDVTQNIQSTVLQLTNIHRQFNSRYIKTKPT